MSDKMQWFVEVDGQKVEVSKEVYQAYKRPMWAEDKRRQRATKCMLYTPTGKTTRCNGDCEQCTNHNPTNGTLSLDELDENEAWLFDQTANPMQALEDKELLEEYRNVLASMEEYHRTIIELLTQGLEEQQIAAQLGISKSTFSYHKHRIFAQIREKLKNFR